jgi:excinuclease ABC subunit B
MGRAARHIEGTVIMYADVITGSMQRAIAEVERRRAKQELYNKEHGITPQAIQKRIRDDRLSGQKEAEQIVDATMDAAKNLSTEDLQHLMGELQQQMKQASEQLEFERAATLRDQIAALMEASADPLHAKKRGKKKSRR